MNYLLTSKYMRGAAGIGCALAITAGVFAYRANADESNRRTVLNVGETMQIQDTVLPPGKYVLKALNSRSDLHIIQIFNGDENHVFATVLTIPVERPRPTDDTKLVFWETPATNAKALRAWYYPGRTLGDEFTYPKHPLQLTQTVAFATPAPAPPLSPAPAVEEAPVQSQPTTTAEPPSNDQPVEIAQNTPPQTPTPPEPAAAAPAPAQSQSLPQTASPYPLFGLAGLGSLIALSLVRLKARADR